jgi:L-lactate dehydrogenase complex protein LldG
MAMKVYAQVVEHPWLYRLAQKGAAMVTRLFPHHEGWLKWLPSIASGWTATRDFPPFADKPFHERYKVNSSNRQGSTRIKSIGNFGQSMQQLASLDSLTELFAQEWRAIGGEIIFGSAHDIPLRVVSWLNEIGAHRIIAWRDDTSQDMVLRSTLHLLHHEGFIFLEPYRSGGVPEYHVDVGITGSAAALADSGTLVVPTGGVHTSQASLLAPIHLALLSESDIHKTMANWLANGGDDLVRSYPNTVLVSGPSRTADIEMTLTIGVHGPGRVVVFCYS